MQYIAPEYKIEIYETEDILSASVFTESSSTDSETGKTTGSFEVGFGQLQ